MSLGIIVALLMFMETKLYIITFSRPAGDKISAIVRGVLYARSIKHAYMIFKNKYSDCSYNVLDINSLEESKCEKNAAFFWLS